ncbi:hypothetical protein [Salipaludibacillus daqingensis]|uniref:hypothetical protein n=1 Tax=Salipaludibacillus daqingensis TaxID=3041001 RepID=UPI002475B3C3|nr:hypothetical protein [Salipaludibacillus daqingensis]
MENYNINELTHEDIDTLYFIAKIHEELPTAWIDEYKVSDETINNTAEELILKHKKKQIYFSIIGYNG